MRVGYEDSGVNEIALYHALGRLTEPDFTPDSSDEANIEDLTPGGGAGLLRKEH